MKLDTIVISDFLDNPDKVRQSLLDQGEELFTETGNFPGKRTDIVNDEYQEMFLGKLRELLPFDIKVNPLCNSFSFQLCLEDDKTWEHLDEYEWTGVLYLTPNPNPDSGTLVIDRSSWKPDCDDYTVASNVANVYNTLVLFRGGYLPHRSNLAGFGDCLENGRLTQVIFFDEVK